MIPFGIAFATMASRSKLLMGVFGFDGFVSYQYEHVGVQTARYGGRPHAFVVYALLMTLLALSVTLAVATWKAARRRPMTPRLHSLADLCHGGMIAMLTMGVLAGLLHATGGWEPLVYDPSQNELAHFMMRVKPPRYAVVAVLTAMLPLIASLYVWGMRQVNAAAPPTDADLIWRTLAILGASVILWLAGAMFMTDRIDGTFTTAALAAITFFWSMGASGLQAATLPRQYQRHPDGHCQQCGYDLRGTIDADRWECPECGEKIAVREQKPTA